MRKTDILLVSLTVILFIEDSDAASFGLLGKEHVNSQNVRIFHDFFKRAAPGKRKYDRKNSIFEKSASLPDGYLLPNDGSGKGCPFKEKKTSDLSSGTVSAKAFRLNVEKDPSKTKSDLWDANGQIRQNRNDLGKQKHYEQEIRQGNTVYDTTNANNTCLTEVKYHPNKLRTQSPSHKNIRAQEYERNTPTAKDIQSGLSFLQDKQVNDKQDSAQLNMLPLHDQKVRKILHGDNIVDGENQNNAKLDYLNGTTEDKGDEDYEFNDTEEYITEDFADSVDPKGIEYDYSNGNNDDEHEGDDVFDDSKKYINSTEVIDDFVDPKDINYYHSKEDVNDDEEADTGSNYNGGNMVQHLPNEEDMENMESDNSEKNKECNTENGKGSDELGFFNTSSNNLGNLEDNESLDDMDHDYSNNKIWSSHYPHEQSNLGLDSIEGIANLQDYKPSCSISNLCTDGNEHSSEDFTLTHPAGKNSSAPDVSFDADINEDPGSWELYQTVGNIPLEMSYTYGIEGYTESQHSTFFGYPVTHFHTNPQHCSSVLPVVENNRPLYIQNSYGSGNNVMSQFVNIIQGYRRGHNELNCNCKHSKEKSLLSSTIKLFLCKLGHNDYVTSLLRGDHVARNLIYGFNTREVRSSANFTKYTKHLNFRSLSSITAKSTNRGGQKSLPKIKVVDTAVNEGTKKSSDGMLGTFLQKLRSTGKSITPDSSSHALFVRNNNMRKIGYKKRDNDLLRVFTASRENCGKGRENGEHADIPYGRPLIEYPPAARNYYSTYQSPCYYLGRNYPVISQQRTHESGITKRKEEMSLNDSLRSHIYYPSRSMPLYRQKRTVRNQFLLTPNSNIIPQRIFEGRELTESLRSSSFIKNGNVPLKEGMRRRELNSGLARNDDTDAADYGRFFNGAPAFESDEGVSQNEVLTNNNQELHSKQGMIPILAKSRNVGKAVMGDITTPIR